MSGVQSRITAKYLACSRVNDSNGRDFLNVFSQPSEELELNLFNCGGQCHDNGANMKKKLSSMLNFCKFIHKRCMFHMLIIY